MNNEVEYFQENVDFKTKIDKEFLEPSEALGLEKLDFILPKIEAIHVGTTLNNNVYTRNALMGDEAKKTGVYSLLYPYKKPIIYEHDVKGEATGRIQKAYFSEYTQAGVPGIIILPKITDEKIMKKIFDERLLTVSVGGRSTVVFCSICNQDIVKEGRCRHNKGQVYNGQVAKHIIDEIIFEEVSWVNVPSDNQAMIVEKNEFVFTESYTSVEGKTVNLSDIHKEVKESLEEEAIGGDNMEKELEGTKETTKEEVKLVVEETEEYKLLLSEKELLTQEVEQLKKEVGEKKEKDSEAETKLEEAKKELEDTIEQLKESLEKAEAEKTKLAETVQAKEEENAQLVTESAKLASKIHENLAERIVDIRLSMNKEENREEAIASYISRTTESLNDTLNDLLKEKTDIVKKEEEVNNGQFRESLVVNPARSIETHEKVSQKDVLLHLFSGKKNI